MNRTKDLPLRPLLAKRVNRPHSHFTIDGIKAMSRGILGRQTSHKICQYEYIVFTVCCEGIYGRYCIEKSDNIYPRFAIILIKILLLLLLLLLLFSTKNSSAMAQTTPKIRSFTLANVSAELTLKKLSFSTKKRN